MKKLSFLAVALIVLLGMPTVSPAGGSGYSAKIWTTGGDIWTVHDLQDHSGYGEWQYWARGETGILSWGEIDWISFLENLHPNEYGTWNREMDYGQRAKVRFNNGEMRELYVAINVLGGKDDWGARRILQDQVTRIDFLETRRPTVHRCPNGHVWPISNGFRYCPYDSEPLTPYEQY